MLRVDFEKLPNTVMMRVEGRLVEKFAEDARAAVAHLKPSTRLLVDLSGMTFVDDTGEEVLSWLKRIGSKFMAETAYAHHVCGRLQLPMVAHVPRIAASNVIGNTDTLENPIQRRSSVVDGGVQDTNCR
jgi:uracil-DNA glycosylase